MTAANRLLILPTKRRIWTWVNGSIPGAVLASSYLKFEPAMFFLSLEDR